MRTDGHTGHWWQGRWAIGNDHAHRDGDAATWLPKNTQFRCEYVARQVAVKAKYGLWLAQAEKDAITRILSVCPSQTLPTR